LILAQFTSRLKNTARHLYKNKATGTMLTDEEGNEYPEMADVGGWHVNMRGELPESIAPYKITVTGTPYRIWD
jgi:hypothetical protein